MSRQQLNNNINLFSACKLLALIKLVLVSLFQFMTGLIEAFSSVNMIIWQFVYLFNIQVNVCFLFIFGYLVWIQNKFFEAQIKLYRKCDDF